MFLLCIDIHTYIYIYLKKYHTCCMYINIIFMYIYIYYIYMVIWCAYVYIYTHICILKYGMYLYIYMCYRRNFWSQTSDNMEKWKSRGGKSQRGEEKKWEEERRERVRKKKMQVREQVRKSPFTVFFQWFVSQEDWKVSCKAAGAQPAGQMRDEKLHAVVARSTYSSQNAQSIAGSGHFWKLRCRKSARRCGAKHISKSKCAKHTIPGPLL